MSPPRRRPRRTKVPCHGCKGEKPWHLGLDERPRERSVPDEKPTANGDATRRRKRVWRTEAVEKPSPSRYRNLGFPSEWEDRKSVV